MPYSKLFLTIFVSNIAIAIISKIAIGIVYRICLKKYSGSGLNGDDVVCAFMSSTGIMLSVREIGGTLTDYYDYKTSVIALSPNTYREKNIAAISVAAHECGHALQRANGNIAWRLRQAIVPVAKFCSKKYLLCALVGSMLGSLGATQLGITFFIFYISFYFITVIVELDASKKAIKFLKEEDILRGKREERYAKIMLTAAAMTYVSTFIGGFFHVPAMKRAVRTQSRYAIRV